MHRVGFFALFHESHSFLSRLTAPSDFRWLSGNNILRPSLNPQVAGFFDGVQEHAATLVPLVDVRAAPSGPVDPAVLDRTFALLEQELLQSGPLDALLVGLHGAMLSPELRDVDGYVLSRLRSYPVLAHIPIVGTLDLHANFSDEMAKGADVLLSYRENPHTDVRETARRAAGILARLLRCQRPVSTVWAHSNMILAPAETASAFEPMRGLLAMARKIERDEADILAVNVFGGYAYADSSDTGLAFSATTLGDPLRAQTRLSDLVSYAKRNAVNPAYVTPDLNTVIHQIRRNTNTAGPVLIVEECDNIGAGAPGDCTSVLRALLEHRIGGSAIVINDPEAAQMCAQVGVNARVVLSLGGKGYGGDPGPISVEVHVQRVSDGRFRLENRDSHMAASRGIDIDMGLTARVVCGHDTLVLITSRPTPPNDLGQWRSQGIEPTSLQVIGIKAAIAHRQAYSRIAAAEYPVSTPGPCPSDLRTLPYRFVRRPVLPLDSLM